MESLNIHDTIMPIDRIKPNPSNARDHSDGQVAQIASSIQEFGFLVPILVDESLVILAGVGRFLAAHKLGLAEVPVRVIMGLNETQKRLYLIADNQIALNSSWDERKLRAAVEELQRELANLDVTGLRPQEIDRLLADLAPEVWKDEDAVPDVLPTPITRPGEVWILDRHRVLCGDATIAESYGALLNCEIADMVFTDSPYNVDYKQKRVAGPIRVRSIKNDDLGDQFEAFLHAACVNVLAYSKGAVYMCLGSSELHTFYRAFSTAGGHWSTFVIWGKDRFTMGHSDYQRQFEAILYGWKKGGAHYWCGARDESDLWLVPRPKYNRMHPTIKPTRLIEQAIRNSSRRGDLVLDPFGGSGSTLITCEKTSRRASSNGLCGRDGSSLGGVYTTPRAIRKRWTRFLDNRRRARAARRIGGNMSGKSFEPGNRFGKGRPPGSRNKKSELAEAWAEHSENIIKKCQLMAPNGDRTTLRLCVERIIPIAKAPGAPFRLPKMETASDLKGVLPSVLRQTAKGQLNAYEAEALARVVETQQRTSESDLGGAGSGIRGASIESIGPGRRRAATARQGAGMNRDLARRIKKLEIAYAKKLEGDRDIRIVWKKAPKTPRGPSPSAVCTTSDATPSADLPMPHDDNVEETTGAISSATGLCHR
jgi:DNA modification methylase